MGSQLDTKNPQDLLFGSAQSIADFLGIDARTVRRYKAGQEMPSTVFKLLQLRYGDLAGVLGSDWEGFTLGHDGKLYPPFFRGGFSALQICAMFFELQELRHLRHEVKRLTSLLARERADTWAKQKVRDLNQRRARNIP